MGCTKRWWTSLLQENENTRGEQKKEVFKGGMQGGQSEVFKMNGPEWYVQADLHMVTQGGSFENSWASETNRGKANSGRVSAVGRIRVTVGLLIPFP